MTFATLCVAPRLLWSLLVVLLELSTSRPLFSSSYHRHQRHLLRRLPLPPPVAIVIFVIIVSLSRPLVSSCSRCSLPPRIHRWVCASPSSSHSDSCLQPNCVALLPGVTGICSAGRRSNCWCCRGPRRGNACSSRSHRRLLFTRKNTQHAWRTNAAPAQLRRTARLGVVGRGPPS